MKPASLRSSVVCSAMLCLSAPAWAVEEVCLINNSSSAVKLEASGSPLVNSQAVIQLAAGAGDQNKCWSVSASIDSINISMSVEDQGGNWLTVPFDPNYSDTSPFQSQDGGDTFRYPPVMTFTNEPIGSDSGFMFNDTITAWAANSKVCGYNVCIYNTGKGGDDVWRVYIVDLND